MDIVHPCSLRMKQNLITHVGTMSYNINKPSSCKQNIASHGDEAIHNDKATYILTEVKKHEQLFSKIMVCFQYCISLGPGVGQQYKKCVRSRVQWHINQGQPPRPQYHSQLS